MSIPAGRTLVLLRHGETPWSGAPARYSGQTELDLTDEGRLQAERAAALLGDAGLELVVTSPLRRARETAEPIARAGGSELRTDPRLTEVGYGPLEGLTRAEAGRMLGGDLARWRADPWSFTPEGLEPLPEALARCGAALDEIVAEGRPAAIVAHQGTVRLLLIRLGRIDRDAFFATSVPPAEPIEVAWEAAAASAGASGGA